jgi:hypothetical protein
MRDNRNYKRNKGKWRLYYRKISRNKRSKRWTQMRSWHLSRSMKNSTSVNPMRTPMEASLKSFLQSNLTLTLRN